MELPSILGPILSKGHNLKGIISILRDKYNIYDPISENIIIPYSNLNKYYTAEELVIWEKSWASYFSNETIQVYLEFKFPKRHFFPTGYSFKSPNVNVYFQTEWIVYGYNEGEENAESLWDVLEHRFLTSDIPFCDKAESTVCNQNSVGTFSLSNQHPKKGYRYIRWVPLKSTTEQGPRLVSGGIDIYGTLSEYNFLTRPLHKTFIQCNKPNYSIFLIILLI